MRFSCMGNGERGIGSELPILLDGGGNHLNLEDVGGAALAGTSGGGMYQSLNKGNSWSEFNSGLESNDVYSVLMNDKDILAGTSGRGVWRQAGK